MIVNDINLKGIKTNQILGNYLVKNGFPLLQRREKVMVFSDTTKLRLYLENLPLPLKLLGRVIE